MNWSSSRTPVLERWSGCLRHRRPARGNQHCLAGSNVLPVASDCVCDSTLARWPYTLPETCCLEVADGRLVGPRCLGDGRDGRGPSGGRPACSPRGAWEPCSAAGSHGVLSTQHRLEWSVAKDAALPGSLGADAGDRDEEVDALEYWSLDDYTMQAELDRYKFAPWVHALIVGCPRCFGTAATTEL